MSDSPDPKSFRDCVAEFATGVTVVTVEGGGVRAGMTLNSFTSVSLDPLLALVSLAHGSRTLEAVEANEPHGRFAINILAHDQSGLAKSFAKSGEPFPEHQIEHRDGWLMLRRSLAVLFCEVERLVPAGDHDLVLGRVLALDHGRGEPLLFHRGRLGGLTLDDLAPTQLGIGGWETVEALG